jgi:hypothetical protein
MGTEIEDYSDDEFFEEFILPAIDGVTVDSSSSDDDVDPWVSHPRIRLPCGDGTRRMDRVAPRPYLPLINGGLETRRHFGMESKWVASISTKPRLLAMVNEHGKISAINSDCMFRCLIGYCDVHGRMVGSPLIGRHVEGTIRHPFALK